MVELVQISETDRGELFRKYGIGFEEEGKIRIHPLEMLYLIERKKIKIKNESFDSLMKKIKKDDKLAEDKYCTLRFLRQRGYIVRPSFIDEQWMRVYRKGFRPGEDRTQWLLKIVKKDWNPKMRDILNDLRKAAGVRKELVYTIVKRGKPSFFKVIRTSFD